MLQQRRPLSCEVAGDSGNFMTDLSSCNNEELIANNVSLNVDTTARCADQKPRAVLPLPGSTVEPLIVHAGAVVSMLHLLPSIACQQQPQVIDIHLINSLVQL